MIRRHRALLMIVALALSLPTRAACAGDGGDDKGGDRAGGPPATEAAADADPDTDLGPGPGPAPDPDPGDDPAVGDFIDDFDFEAEPPSRGPSTLAPAPGFDMSVVGLDDSLPFELHGRIDLTLSYVDPDDPAEGLRRGLGWEASSASVFAIWHFADELRAILEIDAESEGEADVDILAIEFEPLRELPRIRVGFNYVPFGRERFNYAPPNNEFINRPLAFRQVYPGSYGDLGVFLDGLLETPWLPTLRYEYGLFFGLSGADPDDRPEFSPGGGNPLDDNNTDLMQSGRLSVIPYSNLDDPSRLALHIELGASGLTGNTDDRNRERLTMTGFDVMVRLERFELRAEYVEVRLRTLDRRPALVRKGAYVLAVWRERPGLDWLAEWWIGGRWGVIDGDTRVRDADDKFRLSGVLGVSPAAGFQLKIQYDHLRELPRDLRRERHVLLLQAGFNF